MARPSKGLPQAYDVMVEEGVEKRASSSLYKAENLALQDERISSLITASIKDLVDVATMTEKVNLKDTETLKERTIIYMRACANASILPTWSGLMRSIGYTSRSGYDFRNKFPSHPSSVWLEQFHDACADLLAESANRGLTNVVMSIFIEKARNNWRDTITIDTPAPDEYQERYAGMSPAERAEAIRKKYQVIE